MAVLAASAAEASPGQAVECGASGLNDPGGFRGHYTQADEQSIAAHFVVVRDPITYPCGRTSLAPGSIWLVDELGI